MARGARPSTSAADDWKSRSYYFLPGLPEAVRARTYMVTSRDRSRGARSDKRADPRYRRVGFGYHAAVDREDVLHAPMYSVTSTPPAPCMYWPAILNRLALVAVRSATGGQGRAFIAQLEHRGYREATGA